MANDTIPVIDVTPLVLRPLREIALDHHTRKVALEIKAACTEHGFFYVTQHGVSQSLQTQLHEMSRQFFALPLDVKMRLAMPLSGRAWRGYFPIGGELTSGRPDLKEGIYFGEELAPDHPMVKARVPLHGANVFPELPGFRDVVTEYMAAVTALGHALMAGVALSLDLPATYFDDHYTADPLILFRIFHYPGSPSSALADAWGVGEHTDYGLLTILLQDDVGGLQVKSAGQWLEAPPIPGTFVCNIGDMLDLMTGGLYQSTPHRVRNRSGIDRLSFPLFFDPNFSAQVARVPTQQAAVGARQSRWDRANVHEFQGKYGDYLMAKVGKVFPDL